jgi:hypothetical protein
MTPLLTLTGTTTPSIAAFVETQVNAQCSRLLFLEMFFFLFKKDSLGKLNIVSVTSFTLGFRLFFIQLQINQPGN